VSVAENYRLRLMQIDAAVTYLNRRRTLWQRFVIWRAKWV